jgi:hypothetical protein
MISLQRKCRRLARTKTEMLVHDLLFFAIQNKRLIEFEYQGKPRTAEPHDYGIIDGVRKLLVYQLRGESKSGRLPDWRLVEIPDIKKLRVSDEQFRGGRSVPSGRHKKWDELFIRVSPAN